MVGVVVADIGGVAAGIVDGVVADMIIDGVLVDVQKFMMLQTFSHCWCSRRHSDIFLLLMTMLQTF